MIRAWSELEVDKKAWRRGAGCGWYHRLKSKASVVYAGPAIKDKLRSAQG